MKTEICFWSGWRNYKNLRLNFISWLLIEWFFAFTLYSISKYHWFVSKITFSPTNIFPDLLISICFIYIHHQIFSIYIVVVGYSSNAAVHNFSLNLIQKCNVSLANLFFSKDHFCWTEFEFWHRLRRLDFFWMWLYYNTRLTF